ncbi:unnamed protein product [Angiostrongylus costaricensis]|uniref:Uncharacterized protein n=1 Tax=Angiostrongylus costaricensis TaxID=334426 RepID=A0A0R3PAA6_ANGCS|nr:unnamed protein product [Angiostrongylus costaricensis]
MPPSMQKPDCASSVRDRVLEIERSHIESENSVIRARYVPDVRGVNRYKHFHIKTVRVVHLNRSSYMLDFIGKWTLSIQFHSFLFLKENATTTDTHSTHVDCYGEGRSTQTDSYPIVVNLPRCKNSKVVVNMEDIEEREALYQVIENALGETIDRYSRLRTNQIIANSARKQGQIWRDAKDFIANQLVPQSIQLASKSQSRRRTAVEIVTNIRSFP